MAKQKSTEGKDLMLFLDGYTVALATSCSINVTRNMDEANSKDDGPYRTVTPGTVSWDISTDSLFSPIDKNEGDKQVGFAYLFAAMVEGKELDAHFTIAGNATPNGLPDGGWTPKAGSGWQGKVYVNTSSITAANGSAASSSLSFIGNGPLLSDAEVADAAAAAASAEGDKTEGDKTE
jgi:hypothetical protein